MIRIVFTVLAMAASLVMFAQADTTAQRPATTVALPRANDHFMLQVGYTTWTGQPDSISTSGLPRTFNMYFLFDFPFRTNPRFSTAIGAGVATDNVYFEKTRVELNGNSTNLRFRNLSDTSSFKKYKLTTAYLEAPIELRYRSNPSNDRKSFKAAIGAKVGLLVNAHTKGKNLQGSTGNNIGDYTEKISSRRYFNTNRISLTGRVGYGNVSLFGSFAATPLFKEGVAAPIRPLTVGLTLSGL